MYNVVMKHTVEFNYGNPRQIIINKGEKSMKFCVKCGAQLEDDAIFCKFCGASVNGIPTVQPIYQVVDPFDHTSEFDPRDISENKVVAMLPYLFGLLGLIVAILAENSSKYIAFHVRQALKLIVVSAIVSILTVIFCWTIIVPVGGFVCLGIIFVLKIIAFFQVCYDKAKEPAIIRSFGFLN